MMLPSSKEQKLMIEYFKQTKRMELHLESFIKK